MSQLPTTEPMLPNTSDANPVVTIDAPVRPVPERGVGLSATARATRRAREASSDGYSTRQLAVDAIQTEWTGVWAYRMAFRHGMGFEPDPTWAPTDEEKGFLLEGIPADYVSQFDTAVSRDHAYAIRYQVLDLIERRQRLASAGYAGVTGQLLAAVLDPSAIAVGLGASLVSGPLGGGAVAAGKATRLGAVTRAALAGAAGEAAIEGLIAAEDPERGARDVIVGTLAGAAFAGGFEAIATRGGAVRRALAEQQALDAVEGSQVRAMGAAAANDPVFLRAWRETLTDNENRRVLGFEKLGQGESASLERAADEWATFHGRMDQDLILRAREGMAAAARAEGEDELADLLAGLDDDAVRKTFDAFEPRRASQAAQGPLATRLDGDGADVPSYGRELQAGDLPDIPVSDARPMWSKVRFGGAKLAGVMESATARRLGNHTLQDVLPKADGTVQPSSNLAQMQRAKRSYILQMNTVLDKGYDAWRKELELTRVEAMLPKHRRSYDDAVRLAVEHGLHTRALDAAATPGVRSLREAAAGMSRLYDDMLAFAQRHRVPGMENVVAEDTYVNLNWSPARVREVLDKEPEALVDAYARAIKSTNPDWDDDVVATIAKAFPRRIIDSDSYTDPRVLSALRADNTAALDNLADLLREESVDADTIQFVVDSMQTTSNETVARAKKRTWMDLHTPIGETGLTLGDLRENSMEVLFRQYVNEMVHAAGAQRTLDDLSQAAGLDFAERYTSLDQVRSAIARELVEAGMGRTDVEAEMRLVDQMLHAIRGRGLEANGTLNKLARLMRSINFVTFGGSFGLAQIPEIGRIAAFTGWRSMVNSIPELRRTIGLMRSGQALHPDLPDTIEAYGIGVGDRLLHAGRPTSDDVTNRLVDRGSGRLNRANQVASQASDLVARASGLVFIDENTRKLGAIATSQRLWRDYRSWAGNGKLPSKGRLLRMGLDEAGATRMFEGFRAMEEAGAIARRDGSLGIGKFTDFRPSEMYGVDAEAASIFMSAIDRTADTLIARLDAGQLHPSMLSNPLVKLGVQFRTFAIGQWEKGVLLNLHARDVTALMDLSYSWMIASMIYAAREEVAARSQDDPHAYRTERLSPEAIALAGFRRAGPASLAPDLADTAMGLAGADPLFDYRNTGLNTSPVTRWNMFGSNPTTETLQRTGRLIADVTGLWRDDEAYTQSDWHNAVKVLPFHNVEGVSGLLRKLGSGLPEDEPNE